MSMNNPNNCKCTTPQYTIVLNQQGAQGIRGVKGEQGFSPVITVETDTLYEYILKIQTQDSTYTTPNLRGSIPFGNTVGNVLMLTDEEGAYNWQPLPSATSDSEGITQYAVIEDTVADEDGNVEDSKAVTPKVLVDYTKQETDKLETKINEEIEPKLENLQSEFDTKVQELENADTKLSEELTTKEQELKQSISDTQQALQGEIDKKLDTSIAEQTYALKTDVSDLSSKVDTNTSNIANEVTAREQADETINQTLATKQDKLIAGDNITIAPETNTISAIVDTSKIEQDVAQLQEDVQDVVTDLGTKANASEVESLQADVSELQTSVQANTTEIANVNGDLANETAEREEADRAINTALDNKQNKLVAGENIKIDEDTNTISATAGGSEYTLPIASADTLGGVKVGSGLSIDADGTLSATGDGGGEGGTTNYSDLTNKPQINGNTLEGNLTTEQLGIDIPDVSGLVTDEELTSATQDLVSNTSLETTLAEYAKTTDIPDTSDLVSNTALTTKLNDYPTKTELTSDLETKQNKLTAGTGIEIVEDTINATLDTSNLFKLDVDGQKVTGKNTQFANLLLAADGNSLEGYIKLYTNSGDSSKDRIQIGVDNEYDGYGVLLGKNSFEVGQFSASGSMDAADISAQDADLTLSGNNLTLSSTTAEMYITTDFTIYKADLSGDQVAKFTPKEIDFTVPVKVGVKGTPTNLYVLSEQQISRATEDGGLFYTVESEINGTKIKPLSELGYDTLETVDENTIYMIEDGAPVASKDPIGRPLIELSNTLNDDEIWLEGAEVSRTTYAKLFAIYGTTYGEGDGSTTFALPDFRNRTIWGTDETGGFGYIEAGLPNITGVINDSFWRGSANVSGVFAGSFNTGGNAFATGSSQDGGLRLDFKASNSNPIYGNSKTVQPPAIKIRVKTRYK